MTIRNLSLAAFIAFAATKPADKEVNYWSHETCFLAQWGQTLYPDKLVLGGADAIFVYEKGNDWRIGAPHDTYAFEDDTYGIGRALEVSRTWGEALAYLQALV